MGKMAEIGCGTYGQASQLLNECRHPRTAKQNVDLKKRQVKLCILFSTLDEDSILF